MNSTDRSIIGSCSLCGGIVRIKFDVDPGTDVRCPHCQQTSPLGQILEAAVPELEIVQEKPELNSPTAELEPDPEPKKPKSGKLEVSPVLARGAVKKKKRRSGSSRSRRSVRTNESTDGQTVASPNGQESSSRPTRTASRRSSSSGFNDQKGPEIFKVIAGALMAVPIAQLMSWWLVNVDPIRLGPAVAKVIPIIVPQQFRGEKLSPKDKNPKRDNKRNGEAESDQEDLDQDGIDPASDVMEVAPGKDDDNRADEPPDQSNDDPSNEDPSNDDQSNDPSNED